MKIASIIALSCALALTACAGGAQSNRSKLATVESAYGVALAAAVAYRNQKPCPPGVDVPSCSTAAKVATLQQIDRTIMPLIEAAHASVKENPDGPSVASLIQAASSAVEGLKLAVPK